MSDLIDRQAAINAADRADYTGLTIEDVKKVTDEVVKELKQLPSAEPEIIHCRDCKWHHSTGCAIQIVDQTDEPKDDDFCSFAEREESTTSDCISRQAGRMTNEEAIEVLNSNYPDPCFELLREAVDLSIKALKDAKSEIVRCKDCKFYTPMNRGTRTGICRLLMHQNFGDDWYCAGAERITDER